MELPGEVIVTHKPCSNDCFSKCLLIEFRTVKVLVDFISMPSLECKTCARQFQEDVKGLTPRILTSCGHTVCEDCAKRLLKGSSITCPFDRKITDPLNNYFQISKTPFKTPKNKNSYYQLKSQ